MSTTTQTAQPDLAAVKARQQQMWASGDYAAVAARIVNLALTPLLDGTPTGRSPYLTPR